MLEEAKALLQTFVEQQDDPGLCWKNPICPYCKTPDVTAKYAGRTLVAQNNHHWTLIHCKSCGKSSTLENKTPKAWYTDKNHRVLLGFPNCFESYIYTHKDCGGDVVRTHISKRTNEEAIALVVRWSIDGKRVYDYRTFYTCQTCGEKIEVEE